MARITVSTFDKQGIFTIEAEKVTHPDEFKKAKRLFYEIGRYDGFNVWQRSGIFKEIEDIASMIEHDKDLNKIQYINHHNFHITTK